MWPILLKILSIIGIVIACILGVVILLLLLVLLCPIIYRADANAHENKYTAKIKIKYLFGLIRAGYEYPEPGNLYVKALWFTLFNTSDDSDSSDDSIDTSDSNDSDNNANTESTGVIQSVKNRIADDSKNNSEESDKKKIRNPLYYIKRAWENFKYKVITKIQYIIKDIKYYYALWEHDDTQVLVRKIKKHGLKILKIIAPKKGNVNLMFGTGSPSTTGQIYGICCAVFSRWPKTFTIVPDFEQKIIDGSLHIGGWFNLMSLIFQALPIVLSKKLRLTRARIETHNEKKDISKNKAEKRHEKALNDLEEEYSA